MSDIFKEIRFYWSFNFLPMSKFCVSSLVKRYPAGSSCGTISYSVWASELQTMWVGVPWLPVSCNSTIQITLHTFNTNMQNVFVSLYTMHTLIQYTYIHLPMTKLYRSHLAAKEEVSADNMTTKLNNTLQNVKVLVIVIGLPGK